jgi:hypothetical protein
VIGVAQLAMQNEARKVILTNQGPKIPQCTCPL